MGSLLLLRVLCVLLAVGAPPAAAQQAGDSSAGDDPAPTSAGCGLSLPAAAGQTTPQTMAHAGLERGFQLHLPAGCD